MYVYIYTTKVWAIVTYEALVWTGRRTFKTIQRELNKIQNQKYVGITRSMTICSKASFALAVNNNNMEIKTHKSDVKFKQNPFGLLT